MRRAPAFIEKAKDYGARADAIGLDQIMTKTEALAEIGREILFLDEKARDESLLAYADTEPNQ